MKTCLRKSSVLIVLTFLLIECGLADQTDDRISKIKSQIREINSQVSENNTDINLSFSREQFALAELMSSHFCSECGRTKGEIESGGETFDDHLKHANGKDVQATDAARKQKRQEFVQQRELLENQTKSLETQKESLEKSIADMEAEKAEKKIAQAEKDSRLIEQRNAREQAERNRRDADYEEGIRRREQESQKGAKDVAARNDAIRKELEERQATVDRIKSFKENELPESRADINRYTKQGTSDATMAGVAGALKVADGTGQVVTVFLPPVQKELIDMLKQGSGVIVEVQESLIQSGQQNADGAMTHLGKATAKANQAIDNGLGGVSSPSVQKNLDRTAKGLSLIENVNDGDVGGAAGDVASIGIGTIADEKRAGNYSAALKGAQSFEKFSKGEVVDGAKGAIETAYALGESRIPEGMKGAAGKVVGSLDGAVDIYKGAKQFSEATDEKQNIKERGDSLQRNLDSISNRLDKRIQTEEDLMKALRGQLNEGK